MLLITDGHLPVYLVAYLVCDMVPSTVLHNTVYSTVYMYINTKLYGIIDHAQHDTRPRIQTQLYAYNDHGVHLTGGSPLASDSSEINVPLPHRNTRVSPIDWRFENCAAVALSTGHILSLNLVNILFSCVWTTPI